MQRNFILFIINIVFISTICKSQDSKKIWSDKNHLEWSDFEGSVDTSSDLDAVTRSGWDYTYSVFLVNDQYKVKFDLVATITKNKSWVRNYMKTQALLDHEQLHFDISQYFTERLRSAFEKTNFTANFRNEIESINQIYTQKRELMQAAYDLQTNHSKNKLMQLRWRRFVDLILENKLSIDKALAIEPSNP